MENYNILSWLPGELVFYAKNAQGDIGLLSVNGFIKTPNHYADSSVLKWGFMDLRPLKITSSSGHLIGLANHLATIA